MKSTNFVKTFSSRKAKSVPVSLAFTKQDKAVGEDLIVLNISQQDEDLRQYVDMSRKEAEQLLLQLTSILQP